MALRVGIDAGGTFTDLVAVDDASGRWHVAKVPSRPDDPVGTIVSALEAAELDAGDLSFVVVGTTLGINAVLTRASNKQLRPILKNIELLREHRGVRRWLALGGSWGSTLALAYAEAFPDRITEMILFGVTTACVPKNTCSPIVLPPLAMP